MDWKYYNHAMIPTTAPHKLPDITPIDNGIVWKNRGGVHHCLQDGLPVLIVDMKRVGGIALKIHHLILRKLIPKSDMRLIKVRRTLILEL